MNMGSPRSMTVKDLKLITPYFADYNLDNDLQDELKDYSDCPFLAFVEGQIVGGSEDPFRLFDDSYQACDQAPDLIIDCLVNKVLDFTYEKVVKFHGPHLNSTRTIETEESWRPEK